MTIPVWLQHHRETPRMRLGPSSLEFDALLRGFYVEQLSAPLLAESSLTAWLRHRHERVL